MKTTQGILVGAGLLIAYSLIRKAAGAGTLNFFPDKIRGFKFDGLTPVFQAGLGVQNTSNQSYTIKSIAGNVYANGYYVGNLGTFIAQDIPPNTQGIVKMDIRLALIGVVNDLIKAWNDGNFQQEITITGNINVDNLQVPLNLKYKIG